MMAIANYIYGFKAEASTATIQHHNNVSYVTAGLNSPATREDGGCPAE